MRYVALATDYDGTLASGGTVSPKTINSLRRLQQSGRKLILVTGRELRDLLTVFPGASEFDAIVTENGAVLYDPKTKSEKALAGPVLRSLVDRLKARGVEPLSVGRCIIATCEPHQIEAMDVIRELDLAYYVVSNKGSVMILPSHVSKGTGLEIALSHLQISSVNVVGIGDAENDHALFQCCGFSVAVQNALPAIKAAADFVTQGIESQGVEEVVNELLRDDLESLDACIVKSARK